MAKHIDGGRRAYWGKLKNHFVEPLESRRLLSAAVDYTYGTSGIATAVNGVNLLADRGNVVEPDGKLLVVSRQAVQGGVGFAITRLTASGTVDPSFGINGTAIADPTNVSYGIANGQIALEPNGDILLSGVAGQSSGGTNQYYTFIERFLPSGVVDTSFGNEGIVVLQASSLPISSNYINFDGSGRILVAGQSAASNTVNLARLNSNGSTDLTFGTNGSATFSLSGYNVSVNAFAFESDGSFLVGTYDLPHASINYVQMVTHLLDTGAVDASFGSGGNVTVPVSYGFSPLALQAATQGGFYVDGALTNGQDQIVRYTSTGTPDSAFGTNGVSNFGLGSDELMSLHVNSDDSVVAGAIGGNTIFLSKLTAAGTSDSTFASSGYYVYESTAATLDSTAGGNGSVAFGPDGSAYAVLTSGTNDNAVEVAKFINAATPYTAGTGFVSGTVYLDFNGDGSKATSDAGQSGLTVFYDVNKDGQFESTEPHTITATDGTYTLSNVYDGAASTGVVPTSGYVVIGGSTITKSVSVAENTLSTLSFGLYKPDVVTGVVYNDANANNRRDLSESPIGTAVIYDDVNGNGQPDNGEPATSTYLDGSYSLTPAGTGQRHRQLRPAQLDPGSRPEQHVRRIELQPILGVSYNRQLRADFC